MDSGTEEVTPPHEARVCVTVLSARPPIRIHRQVLATPVTTSARPPRPPRIIVVAPRQGNTGGAVRRQLSFSVGNTTPSRQSPKKKSRIANIQPGFVVSGGKQRTQPIEGAGANRVCCRVRGQIATRLEKCITDSGDAIRRICRAVAQEPMEISEISSVLHAAVVLKVTGRSEEYLLGTSCLRNDARVAGIAAIPLATESAARSDFESWTSSRNAQLGDLLLIPSPFYTAALPSGMPAKTLILASAASCLPTALHEVAYRLLGHTPTSIKEVAAPPDPVCLPTAPGNVPSSPLPATPHENRHHDSSKSYDKTPFELFSCISPHADSVCVRASPVTLLSDYGIVVLRDSAGHLALLRCGTPCAALQESEKNRILRDLTVSEYRLPFPTVYELIKTEARKACNVNNEFVDVGKVSAQHTVLVFSHSEEKSFL